jgi:hypothetical protein
MKEQAIVTEERIRIKSLWSWAQRGVRYQDELVERP